jgi:hypothetical protein
MKTYYILIVFVCFFLSCKESELGQTATDSVSPAPIKAPAVENVPGGAVITYTIPEDEDLLYVKAIYTLDNGTVMEQKASAYTNTLKIEGFGKARAVDVQLVAGDRSKNESQAVIVKANPLDAPIYEIYKSMQVSRDFGGVRLAWNNPTTADVVISVVTPNEDAEYKVAGNIYTNAKIGKGVVRGFPSVEREFGVALRDRWGNTTDTLKGRYTPLFEEEIKGRFARFNPPGIPYKQYQAAYAIEMLWDGNIATSYLVQSGGYPYSFTFDMGYLTKLSRIKQVQRQGETLAFTSQNVNKFELWGSATPNVTDDYAGWTKLGDFTTTKPSGSVQGVNTPEDLAFAIAGEDIDMDPNLPPVRYIRYVVKATWSGDANFSIGELKLFGEKQ